MLGKLFNWKKKPEWIVTIKNGAMIRQCDRTGQTEYRDCVNNVWLSREDAKKLSVLPGSQWVSSEEYTVEINE